MPQGEEHKEKKQKASRDTYYVRRLNPSLELIKWDFGALDEFQENQYITAKLESVGRVASGNYSLCQDDVPDLAQLIVGSQNKNERVCTQQNTF